MLLNLFIAKINRSNMQVSYEYHRVRRCIFSFVIILFLLCISCAKSPKSMPLPKAIDIPDVWQNIIGSDAESGTLWWQSFMSKELMAMLEDAFSGNPDLAAMSARMEAAAANARIARADLFPNLSAGFEGARRKQNFIGFPIPGTAGDVLSTQVTTYGLALSSSWELDLWGRWRAERRAAIAESEASLADFAMSRLSLAAQISKAWIGAMAAKKRLEIAQESAASFGETAKQIEERYEAGIRPAWDFQLAMNSALSAKSLVSEREKELLESLQLLEILLGKYPAGKLKLRESLPSLSGKMAAGIPSQILHRRPDLIAAERRLAATDERIKQARAAFFPRIALTASTGTSSPELEDLLDSSLSVWSLASNLTQPIFQGGRIRAGVALSKARSKEAAFRYLGAILQAFSEVEFALASEGHLAMQEETITAAAEHSRLALALANRRYESGLGELIEVLESQRRSLSDATLVIAVRQARLNNRIDLFIALGGGVDE